MRRRARGWLAVALVGLSATRYAGAAPAQDRETARRLFEEAAALEASEQWSEAIPRLRSALELVQTPGLEYHLAYCLEQQGELAQALVHYARAEELIAAGARAPDVEQLLATRQAALKQRVPKLTLALPANPAPETLLIDGEARPLQKEDEPFIVNPGAHRIELRGAQNASLVREVTIREGQHLSLKLQWPARPSAPAAKPQPVPTSSAPREPEPESSGNVARTVVLIGSATLAVAGVGWGVAFTRAADQKADDADALRASTGGTGACARPRRHDDCDDLDAAARGEHKYRDLALGSFIAGGVFAAATVATWFVWKPTRSETRQGVAFGMAPTTGGLRFGATGRF